MPSASERRVGLPSGLDDVFARALAKEPADRYESCEALVLEARAALGLDDPVRHHRRTAWAVAVGVVALAAAIASAILGLRGADSPPSARAGALVAIDLASGKVTRDYATPPVPTHVTTQSGRVWFAAQDGIWRVDPRISGDPVRVENVGEVHDLAGYKGRVYVARDGQKLFEGIVAPYDAVTGVRADGLSLLACSLTANDRIGVWAAGCPNVQQVSITTSSIAIGKRVMIPYTQPTTSGTERQVPVRDDYWRRVGLGRGRRERQAALADRPRRQDHAHDLLTGRAARDRDRGGLGLGLGTNGRCRDTDRYRLGSRQASDPGRAQPDGDRGRRRRGLGSELPRWKRIAHRSGRRQGDENDRGRRAPLRARGRNGLFVGDDTR